MTATTSEIGFRARVRRFTRTAAVLGVAVGVCGFASPAHAAEEELTDAATPTLSVSVGVHGRVAPGAAATATMSVRNDTDEEVPGGRVVVEIGNTPLTDSAAVSTWVADGTAPGDFQQIGGDTADAVAPGDAERINVEVPVEALAALAPGVYPVRATLDDSPGDSSRDDSDDEVTAESVLVITDTAPQVGVIVPITATPADRVLLTSEELSTLTSADGALTAQLDGVTGTAAVLAIDPSILAAIRVLGTAAPQSATEWLARLDELPNERFALQFGDADVTVQSQAQLPELLQPTTLTPFIDPRNLPSTPSTPTPTPAAAATPTPAPTPEPSLPDDETLTRVDRAIDGIVWPRGGVRGDDLAAFSSYLGGEATTIVSSTDIEEASPAHVTASDRDVLVVQEAASLAISRAAAEADEDARTGWLSTASAHLFLAAQSTPQAPLLVGLLRDETRDASALRAAIASVDSIGFDLSSVRASAPTAAALRVVDPNPERVQALESMLVDEGTLASFATILDDPQVLLSRERIRVLREIGVGATDAAFAEGVLTHRENTRMTLGAVSIPPSSTIQLLSANADLPFSIRNDLPWPVTLRLTVAPTDPRLEVEESTDVVVQAATTARVKVPVSARVGSGELDLRLNIYSPSGVLIDGPQTVPVAVRAEWETIGLVVFGSLAVLLIAGGVVRTVLRRRRSAGESGPEADEHDDEAGTPDRKQDAVHIDADAPTTPDARE
ncbi:DUF6049 family protein [Microbacterium sp. 179-I 3D4 NHS]|uniref:DUF6049 family protein n=1 Tax=Microbacterium sp. 179-I 3D4 NHS TaxID=3142381 RepID=UPI0039A1EE1C